MNLKSNAIANLNLSNYEREYLVPVRLASSAPNTQSGSQYRIFIPVITLVLHWNGTADMRLQVGILWSNSPSRSQRPRRLQAKHMQYGRVCQANIRREMCDRLFRPNNSSGIVHSDIVTINSVSVPLQAVEAAL